MADVALKFDGDNDWLSGANLTGEADSKQLLVSVWYRRDSKDTAYIWSSNNEQAHFGINSSNQFHYEFENSLSTNIAAANIPTTTFNFSPRSNHYHILFAIDLATGAQVLFIDDQQITFTPLVNTNENMRLGVINNTVCDYYLESGAGRGSCALQHFWAGPGEFLDITNATNRRKFTEFDVNGQLVPVGLGVDGSTPTGSSPAIYLPFTDLATAGENKGTGGDFTVNGTLKLASTTPDTPSVEAVEYAGIAVADYLSRGQLTGVSDSKSGTLSFWMRSPDLSLTSFNTIIATNNRCVVWVSAASGIFLRLKTASNTTLIDAYVVSASNIPLAQQVNVTLSWDLATASLDCYVQDVDAKVAPSITDGTIDYTGGDFDLFGDDGFSFFNGSISEPFFQAGLYLDLSIEANRRKFITSDLTPANTRQLHAVSGLAPHVYLPNPAATVELNLGSGGDFTKNGTPVDATGTPVYYYSYPAYFDGVNDYLSRAALIGASDGKSFTLAFLIKTDGVGSPRIFDISSGSTFGVLLFISTGLLTLQLRNVANTIIFGSEAVHATVINDDEWHSVIMTVNVAGNEILAVIDGSDDSVAHSSITDNDINLDIAGVHIGATNSGTNKLDGSLAELYFDDSLIDLSVQANLDKFINPASLRPAGNLIQTTGSTPLVYLTNKYSTFEDNLGSGGDFAPNSTLTAGTTSPSDVTAEVAGIALNSTGTITETIAASLTTGIAFDSTGGIAETIAASLTTSITLNSTGSIAETVAASLTTSITLNSTGTIAETVAALLETSRPLNSTGNITETIAINLSTGIVLEGSGAVTETIEAVLHLGDMTSTGTITESIAASLVAGVKLSSSGSLTETIGALLEATSPISSTGNITETIAALLEVKRPLSSTGSSAEAIAASLATEITLNSTGTTTETIAAHLTQPILLSSSGSTSEAINAALATGSNLSSTGYISETINASLVPAHVVKIPMARFLNEGKSARFLHEKKVRFII